MLAPVISLYPVQHAELGVIELKLIAIKMAFAHYCI